MTKISNDVMGYKVVANNEVNYVENFSNDTVWVFNRDLRTNGGSMKWQIDNVKIIVDYFTFTDGADEGLDVRVYVNANGISVKVWFNNKEYHNEKPITSKCGKKMIKDILDDMGVVADVMAVYTNNMVNNNMVDMVNYVDMFNGYVKNVLVEDFKNAVESSEVFANEYGDTFAENKHICGNFDYDYDIERMWAEFCFENGLMDADAAYDYYRANRDMFINEDNLCECVYDFEDTYDVGIEDNCCGSCLIWVKNPYYVSEDSVKNDSPCLERVVDTIEKYVNNYEGILMNYDGNSASICVPWDVFNEDDMKMLIEDDGFEGCVVGALMGRDIKDVLVYDDGVYVSVDAKMFDKVA